LLIGNLQARPLPYFEFGALTNGPALRVTLIHNPRAGSGHPSRAELENCLRRAGFDPVYVAVGSSDIDASLEDAGELVIVAGGDGTVTRIARRLAGREIPLAILPLGTANNIAAALGSEGSVESIIDGLRQPERRQLDVAEAIAPWGTTLFVESAGVGVFARMLAEARLARQRSGGGSDDEDVQLGVRRFQRVLARTRAKRLSVGVDGEDLSGSYLMVVAMNVSFIGSRLELAPAALPGDGQLDVVFAREEERPALAAWLDGLARGDELIDLELLSRRARHVRMTWHSEHGHVDDRNWPNEPVEGGNEDERDPVVRLEVTDTPVVVLVPGGQERRDHGE
jgi:diacylglycerol kinase family enzyme